MNGSETILHDLDKLSGSVICVSDTHITSMDDPRGSLLLKLISRIDGPATEYFILNGDIFDFCFGGTDYFRNKFAPLGDALEGLASRGVKVIYIEGNHEFNLSEIAWPNVKIVSSKDCAIKLASGQKLKFTHGDLIVKDSFYRLYRAIVKSRLFAFLAKTIPSKFVDSFALGHARSSRKRGDYKVLDQAGLFEAANKWLDREFDHGIFGHYHNPFCRVREGLPGYLLCLDAWNKPNALVFREGAFYRTYFTKETELFDLQPVAPDL